MACAKQKGRRFCGECGEFPCEILMEYEKQPGKAGCMENCRRIKAEWVKAARAGWSNTVKGKCALHLPPFSPGLAAGPAPLKGSL